MEQPNVGRGFGNDIQIVEREGKPILRWSSETLQPKDWVNYTQDYLSSQEPTNGNLTNKLVGRLSYLPEMENVREIQEKTKMLENVSDLFQEKTRTLKDVSDLEYLSQELQENDNDAFSGEDGYDGTLIQLEIQSDPYHTRWRNPELTDRRYNLEARGSSWVSSENLASYISDTLSDDYEGSIEDHVAQRLERLDHRSTIHFGL